MTDIYLHIDARMADYIRTHPYGRLARVAFAPGRDTPNTVIPSGSGLHLGSQLRDPYSTTLRLKIIGNEIIKNVGKPESCMVSK